MPTQQQSSESMYTPVAVLQILATITCFIFLFSLNGFTSYLFLGLVLSIPMLIALIALFCSTINRFISVLIWAPLPLFFFFGPVPLLSKVILSSVLSLAYACIGSAFVKTEKMPKLNWKTLLILSVFAVALSPNDCWDGKTMIFPFFARAFTDPCFQTSIFDRLPDGSFLLFSGIVAATIVAYVISAFRMLHKLNTKNFAFGLSIAAIFEVGWLVLTAPR